MNEDGFGNRYLEKMRGLMREEAHLARTHDLLARIKAKFPQLEELLAQIEDRSGEEDGVYRFYHQPLQPITMVRTMIAILTVSPTNSVSHDQPGPRWSTA